MEEPTILKALVEKSVNEENISISKKLEEIRGMLLEVVGNKTTHHIYPLATPTLHHKPASLMFGRFCGVNLEAWILQAECYFDFYGIEDGQKLTMASFYLDGEALEWYQWLFRNKQLVGWTHFTERVCIRFKYKGLESAEGWLVKLRQVSTVSELQGRFEAIANEIDHISNRLFFYAACSYLPSANRCRIQDQVQDSLGNLF